jgi:hypothetical protein
MNKIAMSVTMMAAALLLSAMPAFSGAGPYGSFGPSDNIVMGQVIDTQHTVVAGATGPYGVFGPTFKSVETQTVALIGGTGPYGSFGVDPSAKTDEFANRNECLLAARKC